MKGPRSRTRFFIWRQWECPACGQKIWTSGQVTSQVCVCQGPGFSPPPTMRLVEARSRGRFSVPHADQPAPPPSSGGDVP